MWKYLLTCIRILSKLFLMRIICTIVFNLILYSNSFAHRAEMDEVGLYRIFEKTIKNNYRYENKFTDVDLKINYVSPSGKTVEFMGFFDGDGNGGGDASTGDVWKIRFMPNELGLWKYSYSWSDGTKPGNGSFQCVEENAGKGPIGPYQENPRWFAHNGSDPVWLKSYYETGHGSIAQDFDWVKANVYNPLIENGYNHLQVNWLLSLCCFKQYYLDGPQPSTFDLALYKEDAPSITMNLNVCRLMERHLAYLNEKDIAVHMFLGFDGSRNEGPAWDKLDSQEQEFYVKYMVARIAPFANLAGWNFVWEVAGDRENYELGWARLIKKYDVFKRMVTYEDEFPRENEYHRPEYDFAAVENHLIAADSKDLDRPYWKEGWTHHMAAALSYKGKPVYMSEGNALWRRFWHERSGANQDNLRQAAWGCATAGASFNWNGHAGEYDLYAGGPTGLPFNDQNEYTASEKYIDILTKVMNNELAFYRMNPADTLLLKHDPFRVWALAEEGSQYLVFTISGESFSLRLAQGSYKNNVWIDAKTGEKQKASDFSIRAAQEFISITPPNQSTDWCLIIRKSKVK